MKRLRYKFEVEAVATIISVQSVSVVTKLQAFSGDD